MTGTLAILAAIYSYYYVATPLTYSWRPRSRPGHGCAMMDGVKTIIAKQYSSNDGGLARLLIDRVLVTTLGNFGFGIIVYAEERW